MICVDTPQVVPIEMRPMRNRRLWAHLFDDAGDVEALHIFATRLGLQRAWFHGSPALPHYDVTDGMRRRAIKLGAKTANREDVVRAIMYYRTEQLRRAEQI